jgi:prepilin-type N-terminal cleavage/methylation domain-containing protein
MTSGDARSRARARGFTLLEVLVAFAILAVVLAALSSVQVEAVRKGGLAVDYREVREAADTVFRRIVYEIDKSDWPDGRIFTFDYEYGEYIGLPPHERDRWKPVRGILHKQRRMAAGTDPTGQVAGIEGERTGTEDPTPPPRQGEAGGRSETGEEVYYVSLDVLIGEESQEPFVTLTTYEPLPASERKTEEARR